MHRARTWDWLNVVGISVLDTGLTLVAKQDYSGLERIPRTGAVVVVCNHVSMADPIVLAIATRRGGRIPRFLAKIEVFRWPVVGRLLSLAGHIPVDRGTGQAAAALEPARAALDAGRVVALYPEGKITLEEDYRPMAQVRTGAVRLALEAGCPIVPVAQWGAQRLLSREYTSSLTRRVQMLGWLRPARVRRRPHLRLVVGQPISHADLTAAATGADGHRDLRAPSDLVMGRITGLLAGIAGTDLPHLLEPYVTSPATDASLRAADDDEG